MRCSMFRIRAMDLRAALKQYFGFDSFRPLQEHIIRDALAGKDVFAVLPTGGGKSLCFQAPDVVQPGLTVVVSPLISLMKDQVDAMQASGVAATFLNSTLATGEGRARLRGLHTGKFRLLYVAPERLMLSGFLEDLKKWNVNLIAIDEAHCISEWGHDFRPEYRQLAELREKFPDVPMMALTATATERVRGDIIEHLKLRRPCCYIASFNRPNLTYHVVPKARPYDQVLEFVRARPNESGIVYCQSRKSSESVAARLNEDGIKARPYHAGLSSEERTTNQELFLRDQIRVVCATIAFGMGINKPNVRYVIHYDSPKNIEGYYQETGRAGRDALPSDCVLLFSAGDVIKQTQFIDEKPSLREQKIARAQLQQMVHYAESRECRRITLLRYFGEHRPEENCGGCDNCLAPRETFDGTVAAQKFLSCVYRIRQKNGFGFGLNQIVDVLMGADTENVRKWRHNELSTYGIGEEMKRAEWQAIGRELVRLGHLRQTSERFTTLELTPQGRTALTQMKKITLTKVESAPEQPRHRAGEIPCDEALFERLRALRRTIADARDVPAYIIFSDVALREMANKYPVTKVDFGHVTGVGKKKGEEFAEVFLDEITGYLRTNPRRIFSDSFSAPAPAKRTLGDSVRDTLRRFRAGQSVEEIAGERGFVRGTVYSHLADAIERGEKVDLDRVITSAQQRLIKAAIEQAPLGGLKELKELLGEKVDYGQLRVFHAAKAGRGSRDFSPKQ